ncbi:hypothetical protein MKW94_000614 [Papaver nudicaule]|uniref:Bifunctional inhibitor/plant lipid transfer protein/seed storage helical domain-containing protein n=1 Tax=Papaver nudicaule TaxID=74823 RepID=A0AA41VIB1_PAPNU|nr:hypothetical protein [Papaver nudicaule]
MAIWKVHFCFSMLIVTVGFVTSTSDSYHTNQGIADCRDPGDMLLNCQRYISPKFGKTLVPPSGRCCAAVRNADIEYISREKLLFVDKICMAPPRLHGSNGSYKVQV